MATTNKYVTLDNLNDNLKAYDAKKVKPTRDKVDGIEENAQVNIIESVSVNGVTVTPDADKNVEITIPDDQVQADWNETDETAKSFINNKPTELPASDVKEWAKADEKPTYDYSEIENTPTELPASDVKEWAKADEKPEYDYTEIKNTPTKTSDFTNDGDGEKPFLTEHQSLADYTKTEDLATVATTGSYNDLSDTPTIPVVTDIIDDSSDTTNKVLSSKKTKELVKVVTDLIPEQATTENQLADKSFVNSSISTNTANYKGNFDNEDKLPTTGVTNNDYAFVTSKDAAGNTLYNRYKYNAKAGQWSFEYAINNSGFTATQYAAINSGATSDIISSIAGKAEDASLAAVAKSGSYNDLSDTPTIPSIPSYGTTVNNVGTENKAGTATTIARSDHTHALPKVEQSPTTSSVSPGSGGSFTVIDSVTVDEQGRITGKNTKTVTLPTMTSEYAKRLNDGTNAGFDASGSAMTWGNQDGTPLYDASEVNGGKWGFRTLDGKLNQVINGTIYVDGGTHEVATKQDLTNVTANEQVTIKTGDTAQAKINLDTLMTWLITTKKIIPSGSHCHKTIETSWSYAENDILQLQIDGTNYELQLAGVIIEFMGFATNFNTGMFRILIYSSPSISFTITDGYTAFPVNHIAEYVCNGSGYSPKWTMLSTKSDITSSANTKLNINGSNGTSAGVSALVNKLDSGSTTPSDDDYYVAQYAGGGTTNTTFIRRKTSAIWEYVKGKLKSLLNITTNSSGSFSAMKIGGSNIDSTTLTLQGNTVGTNTFSDKNPKIKFLNSDGSQAGALVFSDYDTVQAPASLTLAGDTGEEDIYFIAPYVKATKGLVGNASSATKATQDGNGNNIAQNYPRAYDFGTITLTQLKTYTNTYPPFIGSCSVSDGPGGSMWYNVQWIPHRNGNGSGDNSSYGQLLMYPMTTASSTFYRYEKASNTWYGPYSYQAMQISVNTSTNTATITY